MNFIICSCETVGLCGVWRVGPICGFGISNGVGLWWLIGMGFDYLWKWWPIKAYCATISTDNAFHFKKMSTNPPNIAIKNLSISLLLRHSLPLSPSCHLTPRHPKTIPDFWTNLSTTLLIKLSLPYYILRPFPWAWLQGFDELLRSSIKVQISALYKV